MQGWICLAVACLLTLPGSAGAQAARHRADPPALDTLMRQFWRAIAASDTGAIRRLTVGEQPQRVAYLFGVVTDSSVARMAPREVPAFRIRGDTAWRAYGMPTPGYIGWLNYTARFEWRCGAWRIIALSSDAAAH